jgi:hypothetical protein
VRTTTIDLDYLEVRRELGRVADRAGVPYASTGVEAQRIEPVTEKTATLRELTDLRVAGAISRQEFLTRRALIGS